MGICRVGRSVLLAVIALAGAPRGQTITAVRTVVNPITNFRISYIDITGKGTGPQLFTLQIAPPVPPVPEARYRIEYMAVCSTTVVSGLVYHGYTGTFALPGPGPIVLTSNEFFADRGPEEPSLTVTRESLAEERVQRVFLSAGIVPSGRIFLRFRLYRVDTGEQLVAEAVPVILDVVTIRYVRAVSPGVDASRDKSDIPATFSPYPQLIWSSDLLPVPYASEAVKFVVSVFENPGNSYTSAELPDSRPVWTQEVAGGASVNYVQYPVSGARGLEPDRVYYWQVRAVLQGPESREIASELMAFKVGDPRYSRTLSPRQKLIMGYLREILGGNYGYVMEELRGTAPKERVLLDGREVEPAELAEIARGFSSGKWVTRDVEIGKQ